MSEELNSTYINEKVTAKSMINSMNPRDMQSLGQQLASTPEDDSLSDGEGSLSHQDDVQAVLQPAISLTASRYTSLNTPAVDKVAALKEGEESDYFNNAGRLENDKESDAWPNLASDDSQAGTPPKIPSPWTSGYKPSSPKDGRFRHTRSVLGAAFGPTRNRSRSAGQEALKRLQKALPSINMSSSFLPSLPTSLRFNDSKPEQNSPPKSPSPPPPCYLTSPLAAASRAPQIVEPLLPQSNLPLFVHESPDGSVPIAPRASLTLRPKVLRRVTSDDSLLYHSLSRTSSLGDDARFNDVRYMVNMRLLALRDSLPDVPSFKMPNLAKFQEFKRSSLSLNSIFSSDSLPAASTPASRDAVEDAVLISEKLDDPSAILDRVLEDLTGDLVILGGYRGSVLRSAEPPHQQLWAPVKLGLNMRKANLEVGLEADDEENMTNTIIPSGMLKNIGPIDISRKFFRKVRSCENVKNGKLRVWDFGYDWRLSPARLSKTLQDFVEGLPSNQPGVVAESRGAIVIAHSLGGLITRHAVNQRPELFAGVLYAGVPQGCINILGPLRNGDPVLFNEKLLTAKVNFSIRTSFTLLPDTGFCYIDAVTGEEYLVDFFDPESWVKWRLSPCVSELPPAMTKPIQSSTSLTSLLPSNFLRSRADSKSEKKPIPDASGIDAHAVKPLDVEQQRNFEYLTRTLAETKLFRSQLAHNPKHESANAYPPLAIIYGKDIPTVYAARVNGREGIRSPDVYDNLVFRSGDGVVLAKQAMLPEGYSVVKHGRVSTERGHITLLGDFVAMGKALDALIKGRRKGIGSGL